MAGIELLDVDIFDNAEDLREFAVKGLCREQALGVRAVDRSDPATKLGAVRQITVGRHGHADRPARHVLRPVKRWSVGSQPVPLGS